MTYTFAQHAKRCYDAAQTGEVLRQWVQVKVGRETACARLSEPWTTPEGTDLWKVQLQPPFKGIFHVTTHRVRPCSGIDGRCTCAQEQADQAGDRTPAQRGQSAGLVRPKGRDVLVTRHFSPVERKNSHA